MVYRLDDRLFFANARYVKGRIREAIHGSPTEVRWLVLDAEVVTHVDVSGLDTLAEIVRDLDDQGIGVAVARLKSEPMTLFDTAGLADEIGRGRFYPAVRAAVQACAWRSSVARPNTRIYRWPVGASRGLIS